MSGWDMSSMFIAESPSQKSGDDSSPMHISSKLITESDAQGEPLGSSVILLSRVDGTTIEVFAMCSSVMGFIRFEMVGFIVMCVKMV